MADSESQAQMALDSEAVFRVPTIIPEDVNHASYYNDSDGLQVPDDILTPLPSAEVCLPASFVKWMFLV